MKFYKLFWFGSIECKFTVGLNSLSSLGVWKNWWLEAYLCLNAKCANHFLKETAFQCKFYPVNEIYYKKVNYFFDRTIASNFGKAKDV